jgi:hypothetical protein
MGILDEIEAEQKMRPDPWNGAEDKLEEWLGIAPEGSMKPKPKKKDEDPGDIKVTLTLCSQATEVYLPKDFRTSVEYARAIKLHTQRIPEGFAAGYILEVEIGKIYHTRRVAMPVKDRRAALSSPEFTLAFTEAIQSIMSFQCTKS